MTVKILRELLRNLLAFRAVYADTGVDTLTGPDGEEYCLWDLEEIYERCKRLPSRQAQAIELFLVCNVRERDVAVMMGVSPNNPVASYATSGLEKLIEMDPGETRIRRVQG